MAPNTAFYASSPSNGALVDKPDQGILKHSFTNTNLIPGLFIHRYGNAFDGRWGDVRHYSDNGEPDEIKTIKTGYIFSDVGDFSNWNSFPIGRLVSEYGFQSFPSTATISDALNVRMVRNHFDSMVELSCRYQSCPLIVLKCGIVNIIVCS